MHRTPWRNRQIQAIIYEQALAAPFGRFAQPAAYRADLTELVPSTTLLFWNVEKK
jgi:peptide/nickel transport system substrate-binding protein